MIICVTLHVGSGHLKTILKETKKLQYLHIGKNTVGDDGIKHIAEGLQENSSLLKLKAYQCGFSAKGSWLPASVASYTLI